MTEVMMMEQRKKLRGMKTMSKKPNPASNIKEALKTFEQRGKAYGKLL
jgi:hypothetical protein